MRGSGVVLFETVIVALSEAALKVRFTAPLPEDENVRTSKVPLAVGVCRFGPNVMERTVSAAPRKVTCPKPASLIERSKTTSAVLSKVGVVLQFAAVDQLPGAPPALVHV